MSLNIETTQGLERRVSITVPAETVVQAIREELKRVAKNARVDGFRKDKVPLTQIGRASCRERV